MNEKAMLHVITRLAQIETMPETEYARELRILIKDAQTIIAAEPTLHWFTVTLIKCPMNFNEPFIVAIQATDRDHAIKRLFKLYSSDLYSTYGYDMAAAVSDKPADADDIANARKHPLPGGAA